MTVKMRHSRHCWTAWPQKQNKKKRKNEPSGVAGGLIVIPETEYYGK